MASNIPVPPESRGMADSPGVFHGVGSPELTTEAVLGQQVQMDAGLSLFLPRKPQLNLTTELDNLRYKLQILRKFADDNRKYLFASFFLLALPLTLVRIRFLIIFRVSDLLSNMSVLSEAEEARQMQYQIECIEAICLEHGKPAILGSLTNHTSFHLPPSLFPSLTCIITKGTTHMSRV